MTLPRTITVRGNLNTSYIPYHTGFPSMIPYQSEENNPSFCKSIRFIVKGRKERRRRGNDDRERGPDHNKSDAS